jgi:hypothetical protein
MLHDVRCGSINTVPAAHGMQQAAVSWIAARGPRRATKPLVPLGGPITPDPCF